MWINGVELEDAGHSNADPWDYKDLDDAAHLLIRAMGAWNHVTCIRVWDVDDSSPPTNRRDYGCNWQTAAVQVRILSVMREGHAYPVLLEPAPGARTSPVKYDGNLVTGQIRLSDKVFRLVDLRILTAGNPEARHKELAGKIHRLNRLQAQQRGVFPSANFRDQAEVWILAASLLQTFATDTVASWLSPGGLVQDILCDSATDAGLQFPLSCMDTASAYGYCDLSTPAEVA